MDVKSEDVLNIAQAIKTAREVKLNGGKIISDHVIDEMITALRETTDKYRRQLRAQATNAVHNTF